jgi:hypothetical protein
VVDPNVVTEHLISPVHAVNRDRFSFIGLQAGVP